MIPKVATALARSLDPIKPIEKSNKLLSLTKSPGGGEGGYGPLGYDPQGEPESSPTSEDKIAGENEPLEGETTGGKVKLGGLPLQPGLTQLILELGAQRAEHLTGTGVQSYETGAREQKKSSRIPKGSMLDKKAA